MSLLGLILSSFSTLHLLLQVSAWISEKMQVATDESYRDPTNLSGKLQKHQAFEAELTANKDRVEGVCMVSGNISLHV